MFNYSHCNKNRVLTHFSLVGMPYTLIFDLQVYIIKKYIYSSLYVAQKTIVYISDMIYKVKLYNNYLFWTNFLLSASTD